MALTKTWDEYRVNPLPGLLTAAYDQPGRRPKLEQLQEGRWTLVVCHERGVSSSELRYAFATQAHFVEALSAELFFKKDIWSGDHDTRQLTSTWEAGARDFAQAMRSGTRVSKEVSEGPMMELFFLKATHQSDGSVVEKVDVSLCSVAEVKEVFAYAGNETNCRRAWVASADGNAWASASR